MSKIVSYSNTESSNTKNINTKKQQHQKRGIHKTDDVKFEKIKKEITAFYAISIPFISPINDFTVSVS